jgi:hypothetical protein
MKGYWENLRPIERRLVVGVLALFFLVVNFLFVIPHFSDLGYMQRRKDDAERTLGKFRAEIDQTQTYSNLVWKLERGGGAAVPQEDQSYQFQSAVNDQVGRSGVHFTSQGTGTIRTQTNTFFLEKVQTIGVAGGESQMVDFLYGLGSGSSLIRVRDLALRPDQPHHELNASVQIVASFQKKVLAKPAASTAQPASSRPSTPGRAEPPLAKTVSPTTK